MATGLLERLNPDLALHATASYALRILEENDKGNFEEAWRLLDEALSYKKEE